MSLSSEKAMTIWDLWLGVGLRVSGVSGSGFRGFTGRLSGRLQLPSPTPEYWLSDLGLSVEAQPTLSPSPKP